MKPLFHLFFSFLLCFFTCGQGWGAACCGGGFAAPSLISGDDKAVFTTTLISSRIVSDVYADGLWRKRNSTESIQTMRLEGAHLLSDRWQAGVSAPLVQRSKAGQGSSGLGDINATLGFEYLPDWDYNPWRPKGIGFLQLTFPTGSSVYQSDDLYGLDSRGRGFWALGLGTLLTKTWGRLDGFLNFDVHRSFQRKIHEDAYQGTLHPGWGGGAGFGAGYNLSSWRFGGGLSWSYEDPVRFSSDSSANAGSDGAPQRFSTGTLSASYLARDQWAGTLSYFDQTLFGNPVNASLEKGLSLQIQKRWAR